MTASTETLTNSVSKQELESIETGLPVEIGRHATRNLVNVSYWGPEHHREDYAKPAFEIPEDLSYSA